MQDGLAQKALDALHTNAAILDSEGVVIAVNEPWKRFARNNGGDANTFYVGRSYPVICRSALESGEGEAAEKVCRGVSDLLAGRVDNLSIEYPFPTPDSGLCWYVLCASRFEFESEPHYLIAHDDVTDRKNAELALEDTQATLRNVLANLPVGVWILDRDGRIREGNPAARRIWGGANFVGPENFDAYKAWWLSSGEPVKADEWAAMRALKNGETTLDEEIRIQAFDGAIKTILNSAIPLRDTGNEIIGAIVVNQDISARKAVEEKLLDANERVDVINRELEQLVAREQRKARTDGLTSLFNRMHFFELAETQFAVAQRYRSRFSIILFDIDHFKKVNDRYGHQAGDVVLKQIARIARKHVREADILARYGGEEFIIALPNTGIEGALKDADSLRRKIAGAREEIDGLVISITISAGVAELSPGDTMLEHMIKRADEALYAAKHAGRNCVRKG